MAPRRAGFFAFPPSALDEVKRLDQAWSDAAHELRDDSRVHHNALYRFLATSATAYREVEGDDACSAVGSLRTVLAWLAWDEGDLEQPAFFQPGECRTRADAVLAWEQRVGGEPGVVRRLILWNELHPAATYARVYRAYREVLIAAGATGAGFRATTYDPDAGARLARQRREREELERQLAAPPAPAAAAGAGVRLSIAEYSERIRAERIARAERGDDAYDETEYGVELSVLPAATAAAVALLRDWADRLMDDLLTTEGLASIARTRRLARLACDDLVYLQRVGEVSALRVLHGLIEAYRPGVRQVFDVYLPEQAAALHRAFLAWQAEQGGRDAAIDRVNQLAHGHRRPLTGSACNAYERLLAAAVAGGHGFYVLTICD